MKTLESKWLPWAVVIVLIFLLAYTGCDHDVVGTTTVTKDVPITLPEISGSIEQETSIEEIPIVGKDSIKIGNEIVYVASPLDSILKEELKNTKNAYQTLLEANRKREFSQDFNDDNVDINVSTTVFGRLDDTKIKYKIKEKTVMVPQTTITTTVEKKDNFSWLAGGGANRNLETQSTNFEAAAGVRVKDIIAIGTINTDKQVGIKLLIQF